MSTAATTAERFAVAVPGGLLAVWRWPAAVDGAPVVVAAHGITGNHAAWTAVADALAGEVTLVAPDLRGRGASADVGPPYGITVHADDLVRLLDHLGLERAALAGHSMGAWVVANAAVRHPERVASVLAVDGGVSFPVPDDIDVTGVLAAGLGPSMARLSMRFDSLDAYRRFWLDHPAVGGRYWTDAAEAFVAHDCVPADDGSYRSSVRADVVEADATEQLTDAAVGGALEAVSCPTTLLRATRGMVDGDPLFASPVPTRHPVVDVDDTNHFSIVLADGAPIVADAIRSMVAVGA